MVLRLCKIISFNIHLTQLIEADILVVENKSFNIKMLRLIHRMSITTMTWLCWTASRNKPKASKSLTSFILNQFGITSINPIKEYSKLHRLKEWVRRYLHHLVQGATNKRTFQECRLGPNTIRSVHLHRQLY